MKKRFLVLLCAFALLSELAIAKYIGPDPHVCCSCTPTLSVCTGAVSSAAPSSGTGSRLSLTEGNLTESVPGTNVRSSVGSTIKLDFVYNSYNADGSRAIIDTVMGYGWTHSYNIFLFSQAGVPFRWDGIGRITKFGFGPNGTFIAPPGYFETLTQSGGVFTITKKDQTKYTFALIPGTPFLVSGPVYRLTSIVDRNGNTTTLTYSGGNLTKISDTYGRIVTLAYNAQNKLTSVTDPLARVTTLQYDSTGHKLIQLADPTVGTDPTHKPIQYTYNLFYQLTGKTDQAGRTFSYGYTSGFPGLPVAVQDSRGAARSTLSNPNNWSTDPVQLALFLNRVYTPSTTTNTDGRGNRWKYSYDSKGYITQQVSPDNATTKYTYDPATFQVSSMTNANGDTTTYQYDSMGNLIKKTDALGHMTTYTYDPVFNQMTSMTDPRLRVTTYTIDPANGNHIKETDPLGQTRSWTYDSHGNALTDTDKHAHTTTYHYDPFGNADKITDPLGNMTSMTYDIVGNVLTRKDADGHTTKYQYDGMDRLVLQTDATTHTDQYFYDGDGNRIQVIDRNGHSTQYQYDFRQRPMKVTDAVGNSETYAYDGNDNRISMTDRNVHTTTYGYDLQNRINKVTDALGDMTTTIYDPVSNMISQTDADGHTTTYSYDVLNRRVTMTDALSEVTKYFYDGGTFTGPIRGFDCNQCGATPGSSLVTGQIDPDGNTGLHAGATYSKYDALDRLVITVRRTGCIGTACTDTINPTTDAVTTYVYDPVDNRLVATEPNCGVAISPGCDRMTYAYDADNRMIQQTNNAGDVTLATYDGVSNVITVTVPNLNVTTNAYDSLNRLIKVTDSAGPVASYTYDPVGNRLSSADGDGNTTGYSYDALNRQITITDPLGKTTTNSYDPVGNLFRVTNRNGNPTTYTYDGINRRVTMTDALPATTQYQYDPVGNLIKIIDANLHATSYSYDAVNRPQQETYADGLSYFYGYDPVGNLIRRTDQIGQTTNYNYSDLYFLLSRTYPSGINDTFAYDPSGRMLMAQRGSWPISFIYDGGNRVTQTVQNARTVSYAYNIPGRIRAVTYNGGRVITEHTDARSRMDHLDDASSPPSIAQYNYDAANNVLSRNYRNGTTSSFTYNQNNWMLSIAHNNRSTFAGFNYAYDNEGNKLDELKTHDTTHSEAYKYDTTYRLIDYRVGTLVGFTVPLPSTETSYNLDPVGNWNSKTTDAVMQTRVHNADNELVKIDAQTLTYDNNGNTQTDGAYTYAYDEENRLTEVTRNSDSAVVGQYQYDALSRRVQKIANAAGVSTTTLYFYDAARIIEEQTGGVTQATYVYGNYVDEVLTMDRGGQTYYYHQSALWSVEAITDNTGTPVERYSYDAYGSVTISNGTGTPVPLNAWGTPHSAVGNPWMFTGRQLDEEAGLYFYRARYHDPSKGRFVGRDPLEYVDGMNLYQYVKDAPTKMVDPSGQIVSCDDCYGTPHDCVKYIVGSSCTVEPTVIARKPEELTIEKEEKVKDEIKTGGKVGQKLGIGGFSESTEISASRTGTDVYTVKHSVKIPSGYDFVTYTCDLVCTQTTRVICQCCQSDGKTTGCIKGEDTTSKAIRSKGNPQTGKVLAGEKPSCSEK